MGASMMAISREGFGFSGCRILVSNITFMSSLCIPPLFPEYPLSIIPSPVHDQSPCPFYGNPPLPPTGCNSETGSGILKQDLVLRHGSCQETQGDIPCSQKHTMFHDTTLPWNHTLFHNTPCFMTPPLFHDTPMLPDNTPCLRSRPCFKTHPFVSESWTVGVNRGLVMNYESWCRSAAGVFSGSRGGS